MDRVLFVVNMQEMYVGKSRNKNEFDYEAEELIDGINKRIGEYAAEEVFYIISIKKGLFGGNMPKEGTKDATFPAKLKIVSKNIYQKNKLDAFTSVALEDFCRARNVKEIEFVGVDGVDIASTAAGALDCGMKKVIFNEALIGTLNKEKELKVRATLKQTKVEYI